MLVQALFSGCLLGLVGNIHCLAMCGPLAMGVALPKTTSNKAFSIALYNVGRLCSYSVLGILFGFLGNTFVLWNLQQTLSIFAGVLLLLFVFTNSVSSVNIAFLQPIKNFVQKQLSWYWRNTTGKSSYFFMGIFNGLLPCGLVYVAAIQAMANGTVWGSTILMMGFGLGTFPLMIAAMFLGHLLSVELKQKLRKIIPVFITIMAVLLIVRGLGLNIPYVSPFINTLTGASPAVQCH